MFKAFSTYVPIIRKVDGYFNDDGDYVHGSTITEQMYASVQPLGLQEMNQLNIGMDGGSFNRSVKIYGDKKLIAKSADNAGDVIIWAGAKYRVIYCMAHKGRVIEHYKSIAVEITDDDDA